MLFRRFGLAAVAALVAGMAFAMDSVSVTATYRERIAMPPGVVFEARLEDVSRADAPSILIGEARIEDAGNPPYRVTIDYDPAAIDARFTYAVRASLTHEGKLLFTTDTHVPVLTRGAPDAAEIVMVRVASSEASAPLHGLDLPASFTGDLPCADCEAIRHHLDLWPDQGFHLRREWIGGDAPLVRDSVGRWSLDPARNALVLWTGGDERLEFAITEEGGLRLLDQDGRPILSDLPYELASLGRLAPTEIAGPMIGEFTYFADAARFVDCRSGRSFPVAMEGGQVQTVTVDRFDALWPELTCERARADARFGNTYWRIHWLDGTALEGVAGTREPHVVFRPEAGAYAATVGCNQINGRYEQAGNVGLRLRPGAMTRMACPPPLDAQERLFLDVIERVAGFRILGPTMAFLDEGGAVIARFEAVYLP
jgi:uncharacterized lipoprotein YbaY/heat shock protein HslJ